MYQSYLTPSPPFYFGITPQLALAAGATVTPSINVSNECDFEAFELTGIIHKAAAFSGNVVLQLQLANGEIFSNVGIDMMEFATLILDTAVSPSRGRGIRLPMRIRIPASSVINVQITNNNGEVLESVQVGFWGIKVSKLNG
jgi:hypothetical protein